LGKKGLFGSFAKPKAPHSRVEASLDRYSTAAGPDPCSELCVVEGKEQSPGVGSLLPSHRLTEPSTAFPIVWGLRSPESFVFQLHLNVVHANLGIAEGVTLLTVE